MTMSSPGRSIRQFTRRSESLNPKTDAYRATPSQSPIVLTEYGLSFALPWDPLITSFLYSTLTKVMLFRALAWPPGKSYRPSLAET